MFHKAAQTMGGSKEKPEITVPEMQYQTIPFMFTSNCLFGKLISKEDFFFLKKGINLKDYLQYRLYKPQTRRNQRKLLVSVFSVVITGTQKYANSQAQL